MCGNGFDPSALFMGDVKVDAGDRRFFSSQNDRPGDDVPAPGRPWDGYAHSDSAGLGDQTAAELRTASEIRKEFA